jgi:hypothetical protein
LGAFEFRANKINQLRSGYENLNLTPEQVALFPTEFGSTAVIKGDYVYNNDNNQPEVGDYRVRFSYLPNSTEASIIGQQDGESILAYTADSGNEILLIEPGLKTAEAMVESAQKSNSFMGWLIRGGGTLLVIIGISLILAPLAVLASVLPFLGSITGGITGGIAFVLGLFISLITIGMAWVFYRPVIGIALLLAAFASLTLLFFMKKKGADPTVNEPANVAPNQNSSVQTSPISAATPAQPTPVQNINPAPMAAVAPAGVTPVANTNLNPATAQNPTPQPTAANPFANPAAATPPVQTAPTSNSTPTPTTPVQNINAEPIATATPSGATPTPNTNLNPAPVQNSVPQPTAANPFANPVAATPPAATPTVETPTTPPPTSNPFA